MRGFWKLYLRGQLPALGLFALCCAVFGAAFWLYRLPLGAVGYPALVSLVLWLVYALLRGIRAVQKHQTLSALTAALTEDMLPDAATVDDADYRRIIALLREARRTQELGAARKYADMVDYYTLWAHQIKTPIASMRLTLQNEDTPLSRRLTAELGRVERYVEMVLAYLRLDADATDYVLRECELDPIVRGAVKKFSGEFIERRLSLDLRPTNLRVLTDEKWLAFVLEQLLSNALKYTPAGRVSIYLESPATLCVADTGIGVAPEDLPRIFEQGFTGYNGRADKQASGLGLYLCRRVCQNLGHTISAESEPGRGTVIRLDLSCKKLTVE
ncbi:MAG: HAMP domain-containing histidine kinase [Ruminococcaceae bacterium]|nr:HAMP domain-containing histidine kinase [Oscillospiraceae bacterium]